MISLAQPDSIPVVRLEAAIRSAEQAIHLRALAEVLVDRAGSVVASILRISSLPLPGSKVHLAAAVALEEDIRSRRRF